MLDAKLLNFDPYTKRTLSGEAYVALISFDGALAIIYTMQIAFEA